MEIKILIIIILVIWIRLCIRIKVICWIRIRINLQKACCVFSTWSQILILASPPGTILCLAPEVGTSVGDP